MEHYSSDTPPLNAPFGTPEERATSSRYHWRNAYRGAERFAIVQLTLDGLGIFAWRGRRHPVPADHAFVALVPESSAYFFPGRPHGPWRFAWLNFYGPLAVLLARQLRERHGAVVPLPAGSAARSGFARLVDEAGRGPVLDPWEHSGACYAFWMDWMRTLGQPVTDGPVAAAERICRARYRERLGVKEIAAEIGVSREHLTRLFVQQTGRSPAAFLRELRVNAARPLLAARRLSAREIAFRCGFPSVRALRAAVGAPFPTAVGCD